MGMLCNERASEEGKGRKGGIMVFIAAVASSIWCQPGSGTGTVFRTTHAQGFLPSPERDKSESIPVCSNFISDQGLSIRQNHSCCEKT